MKNFHDNLIKASRHYSKRPHKVLPRDRQAKPWDYRPITVLYPPLAKSRAQDLTYEIFLELINKTDYLLRRLVESLEKKQVQEKKYYQVEQARIKEKFKKRR